jgi:hypothetical protein
VGVHNVEAYCAGRIVSHPFGKLRAGSSKTAKGGASSVVLREKVGQVPRNYSALLLHQEL